MNRSQCILNKNARRSIKKAVRQGQRGPDSSIKTMPAGRPTQATKNQTQRRALAVQKALIIKKNKEHAKHSRRTSPGSVSDVSPPHSIHVEGARWISTLKKQNKVQSKRLMHNLAKASPKRGFQGKSKAR